MKSINVQFDGVNYNLKLDIVKNCGVLLNRATNEQYTFLYNEGSLFPIAFGKDVHTAINLRKIMLLAQNKTSIKLISKELVSERQLFIGNAMISRCSTTGTWLGYINDVAFAWNSKYDYPIKKLHANLNNKWHKCDETETAMISVMINKFNEQTYDGTALLEGFYSKQPKHIETASIAGVQSVVGEEEECNSIPYAELSTEEPTLEGDVIEEANESVETITEEEAAANALFGVEETTTEEISEEEAAANALFGVEETEETTGSETVKETVVTEEVIAEHPFADYSTVCEEEATFTIDQISFDIETVVEHSIDNL